MMALTSDIEKLAIAFIVADANFPTGTKMEFHIVLKRFDINLDKGTKMWSKIAIPKS